MHEKKIIMIIISSLRIIMIFIMIMAMAMAMIITKIKKMIYIYIYICILYTDVSRSCNTRKSRHIHAQIIRSASTFRKVRDLRRLFCAQIHFAIAIVVACVIALMIAFVTVFVIL